MKLFKNVFNSFACVWVAKGGKKAVIKYLVGVAALGTGVALTVNGSSEMSAALLCDFFDKSIDRLDDDQKEAIGTAMDEEAKKFNEKWG